jgi:hypothetical protein
MRGTKRPKVAVGKEQMHIGRFPDYIGSKAAGELF